jgi:hypothetical protein
MNTTAWILIITLFGSTSQSGKAVAGIEFGTEQACIAARNAWLQDLPRDKDGSLRFSGDVRILCVRKSL